MILALVLSNCAHVAGQGNSRTLPSASQLNDVKFPTGKSEKIISSSSAASFDNNDVSNVVLDETALKELLAGFELELGDEKAKTARCLEEKKQFNDALIESRANNTIRPALIGGAVGIAIGVAIGAIFGVLSVGGSK